MARPSHQAFVESDPEDSGIDYDRRSSPSAQGQANVAAKRSHPSDLGADKSPTVDRVVNIDQQSDSGYSSHTAATMSSADSAPSATSRSPPTAAANTAPLPQASPAMKRRPTLADERKHSSQSSPRKPLQRTDSVSSRQPSSRNRNRRSTVTEDCTDPDCTTCGPNAANARVGRRPPDLSPLDSGLDISYHPFEQRSRPSDQRSQRSDPAPSTYASPQSPTYRQPAAYTHGPAVVQPAQSTRRRSSSARPMSYHGEPGQPYWVQGMPPPMQPVMGSPYGASPLDYGPPPAMSAYHAMPHPQHPQHAQPQFSAPFGMPGGPPPNAFYGQPQQHPMQTAPPFEAPPQRPPLPHQNSSNFHTRRPTSQYGPTLVTQSRAPADMPSARYAPPAPQSAKHEKRYSQSQLQYEDSSSEYESSEDEEERRRTERALMPPPALTSSIERRPSLGRRPATTQPYPVDRRPSMSQSMTLPERHEKREARPSRTSTAAPSRAASISRPALVQHKAQSSFDTPRNARVIVENSQSRRRQSYQAQGRAREYDVEMEERPRTKVYRDDGFAVQARPRRPTESDRRGDQPTKQPSWEDAADDVEAYQQRTRGSEDPLTEKVHKAAKRQSRVLGGPSDAKSTRSRNSDKASRVSQSNRTTVTNGADGEIRLRVDAGAPLSLSFNGDMGGRTLHFEPGEDGMANIVIANPRGNENVYPSERGSVLGSNRKSLTANPRRDAEEVSVQSGRSRDSRREGERRGILRRKQEIQYHEGNRF